MRIIIIGGGIAGLSSYLFLRKHLPHDDQEEHSIVIYEAHDLQPYVDSIAVSSVGADEGTGGSGGSGGRGGARDKAANHLPNNLVAAERDRDREEPSSFTPEAIGSAIGISLNGLNVLSRLGESDNKSNSISSNNNSSGHQRQPASSSQLIAHLLRDSHPVHTWQMTSARGWKLIDVAMLPKQQREQQQKTQQARPPREDGKEGISDHGTVSGIMISRQAFWRVLLAELVHVVGVQGVGEVVKKGRVRSVVWLTTVEKEGGRDDDDDSYRRGGGGGSGSGSVEVVFEDGRRDRADLVIGADGVRSTVRKAMFQQPRGDDTAATAAAGVTGRGSEASEESDDAKQVYTNPASSTNSSGLLGWLLSLLSSSAGRSTAHKEPGYVSPRYEGLVGVGGFIPSSVLRSASPPHEPGNMGIVFGPNGFFGYGYITTSPDALPGRPTLETTPAQMEPGTRAVWWSTFGSTDENPYPVKTKSDVLLQATDGNTKTPRPRPWDFDHAAALEALLDRHRSWKDPTVQAILSHLERSASNPTSASDTNDHQNRSEFGTTVEGLYPTWTTPWLPTWHSKGVVLVGDAAHAMQPSSGQGACQALEDAETLARCLGHFLRRRRPPPPGQQHHHHHRDATTTATSIAKSVEKSLQAFEKVRVPRVKDIYDRSQRMGRNKQDMGVVGEMVMYAFLKLMGLVGGVFGDGGAMQRLLAYDLPAEVEKELAREE